MYAFSLLLTLEIAEYYVCHTKIEHVNILTMIQVDLEVIFVLCFDYHA